ncbi:MAG: SDR family oxidoreductase [Candidatus Omnitrophica bacterium]|nr:putative oxidoreductase UxuB [bacterium]NUN97425.1 SDR family oxidoreductase [Candidatus Omnitrophota bacterium]
MSESYFRDLYDLEGKVAVLFGGTGELVSAIAKGFAGAGMKVALGGRNPDKARARIEEIRSAFPASEAVFIPGQAGSREDVERTLAQTLEQWGRVDVLVNGAGVNSATPFLEISDEEFNRILNTNLQSVMIGCQVFGKHFLSAGHPASILNISSASARIPLSRVFTYSASKAAILNLTLNLAREWGEKGIRVNALTPGFFPAEQNRKVLTPERVESIMRHTPMNRFGNPEELVGAALLLASSRAGAFITGADLVVDGGFTAMTI